MNSGCVWRAFCLEEYHKKLSPKKWDHDLIIRYLLWNKIIFLLFFIYLFVLLFIFLLYPFPLKDLEILQLLPYLDANNPGCEAALDDLLRAYGECLPQSLMSQLIVVIPAYSLANHNVYQHQLINEKILQRLVVLYTSTTNPGIKVCINP